MNRLATVLSLISTAAGLCLAQTTYSVQVFAGASPLGDGGPAAAATLQYPSAMTFDAAGNLYIADALNGRIRRVTPDGLISTIAGTGVFGYSGDGGPAIQAQISAYTTGIVADANGSIYFSDSGNAAIRKIAPDGSISTILNGSAVPGTSDASPFYPGVMAIDSAGNLFVTDINNYQVLRLNGDGSATRIAGNGIEGDDGDEGPATAAQLDLPGGLLVDTQGAVYVSDVYSHRVRKITPDGMIHAFAGSGDFSFGSDTDGPDATLATIDLPWSIRQDPAGNIYVLDVTQANIRCIRPDGSIFTVAGTDNLENLSTGDGGLAVAAQINTPLDIAFSPSGDLYVVDSNSQIRVIGTDGVIRTAIGLPHFAGDGGPATQAVFAEPSGLALDSAGNLYVADQDNFRVRKIDRQGLITTIAGSGQFQVSGDGGPATAATIGRPLAVATDPKGNLYISAENQIRKIALDGTITTIAGDGYELSDHVPGTSELLAAPRGIVADGSGNVYIADTYNARVMKLTPDGLIARVAGTGLLGNSGDGGPAAKALLDTPSNLALDAAGNLYIADSGNARIRVVTPDGNIKAFAGTGRPGDSGDGGPALKAHFTNPVSLAVDAAGNLLIGDAGVKKIRMVTPDGNIRTLAGAQELDAIPDFTTVTGDALYPQDYDSLFLAVDATGRIYVADEFRERILVLTPK